VPASTGIPRGAVDSVIVLPPDLAALESILASDNDIAGVITEGSGASYGTVPLEPGFVQGVRDLTRKYDVVMILDEVITGFRWSPGGLQQNLGIEPDLCTMAKILTGGLPGGAVAGREQFMAVMEITGDAQHDRYERVYHGGTFNANPYCAATGNAALNIVATGEMQANADRMASGCGLGCGRSWTGTRWPPASMASLPPSTYFSEPSPSTVWTPIASRAPRPRSRRISGRAFKCAVLTSCHARAACCPEYIPKPTSIRVLRPSTAPSKP